MKINAEAATLQQRLLESQNSDGGWGFQGRTSWTEPTAFCLLALTINGNEVACARAVQWLKQSQRQDGGWAPQPGVAISTWITSLVTLSLLQQNWRGLDQQRALDWLRGQIKPADPLLARFIERVKGSPALPDAGSGTSWFPGTAAWVYPTAMAVLTLQQTSRLLGDQACGELGRKGQDYILSRRARDGGWNHGGSRFLSDDAFSYPELTGLALLALGGVPKPELIYSIKQAQNFVASPLSGEGLSWLQMGLAKHNASVKAPETTFPCRNPRDLALRLLALSAEDPRNFLVSPHSL